jgi:hypothetical protein
MTSMNDSEIEAFMDGFEEGRAPCPLCHQYRWEDGIDPCLRGRLPGVDDACCGHGLDYGYLVFQNGVTIKFDRVLDVTYRSQPLPMSWLDFIREWIRHKLRELSRWWIYP